MIDGIIVKGIGGFYYVACDKGVAECRARGKFRKEGITPMVGDRVGITIVNESPLQGALEEIFPRTNSFIRPPVANVDTVVIVIATVSPAPDYLMVDKLIATAEKAGIEVVVAVNKTDIASPDETASIYEKAGFPVVKTCAVQKIGISELKQKICGKVSAFAGNSGVGKSSLLNGLGFNLEVGQVSKIDRGKHTTRHVELLPLEGGGYVIDTPGFSLLDVNHIKAEELKKYFREFAQYEVCSFADCAHYGVKAKNCGVVAAVEQGKIGKTRFESYVNIYSILKNIKEWEK